MAGHPFVPVTGLDPSGAESGWPGPGGAPAVLAFLTASCTTCQVFWAALAAGREQAAGATVVVVTPSPSTESRRAVAGLARDLRSAVVMSSEAWHDYGVRGAPWFVLVEGGTVRTEGTAASWAELERLAGGP